MKKFNSILAIATVALTSVFGFTSCDKADDDVFNQPNPVDKNETKYFGLQVAINEEAFQFGDVVITTNINGQEVPYSLSEGQAKTMTKRQIMQSVLKNTNPKALEGPDTTKVYNCRVLTIPTTACQGNVEFHAEFIPNESANMDMESKNDFVLTYVYTKAPTTNFALDVTSITGFANHFEANSLNSKFSPSIMSGLTNTKYVEYASKKANLLKAIL